MVARNALEAKVLEMLAAGTPVHDLMKDVLIEMMLREKED